MRRNQSDDVLLTKQDSMERTFEHSRVAFRLKCPASQAYLLIARPNGKALALEQMTGCGDVWSLTLDLKPGTYRYRYYIIEGHRTSYFSPVDAENGGREVHMDGMDAVFDVAPAGLQNSSSRPSTTKSDRRHHHIPASGICSGPWEQHHCIA